MDCWNFIHCCAYYDTFSSVRGRTFFFKSDAEKLLTEHNIELKDNFKLNFNEFSGIFDFYHRFELTISEKDKTRLVEKIISADNFQENIDNEFDFRVDKPRYAGKKYNQEFTANYHTEKNTSMNITSRMK